MENDKIKGYLNISRKAGYIIFGGETLENYNKKLYLVIYDPESAKNTYKIIEKIKNRNIPVVEMEKLSELLNLKNCKVIGLKNKNISDQILSLIEKGV